MSEIIYKAKESHSTFCVWVARTSNNLTRESTPKIRFFELKPVISPQTKKFVIEIFILWSFWAIIRENWAYSRIFTK